MKIKRETVNRILGIMHDTFGLDGSDDALYENYSGRGMLGTMCVGFVIEPREAAAFGAAVALALADDLPTLVTLMMNVRSDSLGLQTIIYFPDAQLED